MRILFLTHYFPPEVNAPASRTYEHCKRWVEEGHKVVVLTCVPNHPKGKLYPGYKNKFFQKEKIDGIEVYRIWTFLAANKGFLKRTLNYLIYAKLAILVSPFLPKADVVISTSPQFFCGLSGFFVAKIKRATWVLEIRDLWPESIVAVGAIKNKRIIKFLEWLEKFAYKNADGIISVTDSFKRHMIAQGINPDKIAVVKNGVDLSLFSPIPKKNEFSKPLGISDKFVVSYFGTLGMAHGLKVVLEAAKKLENNSDIVFLIVGDGAEREHLLRLKDEMKVKNVLMLPQVEKSKMPLLWGASDVSMVLLKKDDLFKTVIPSKIFEAMAMKKPIILGVEGESQEILRKSEAGICIEPENADELAKAVLKFYADPSLVKSMGENGRVFVEKNFSRDTLANDYLRFIETFVRSRNATLI